MKRTDPMSIRQIIDKVINEAGNRKEITEHRAAFMWADVVGHEINRMTTSRYVKGGVLHVTISSASVKNELGFMKEFIIGEINRLMESVVIHDIIIH